MSGITSGIASGRVIREGDFYNSYYGFNIPNQWLANYQATSGEIVELLFTIKM